MGLVMFILDLCCPNFNSNMYTSCSSMYFWLIVKQNLCLMKGVKKGDEINEMFFIK